MKISLNDEEEESLAQKQQTKCHVFIYKSSVPHRSSFHALHTS